MADEFPTVQVSGIIPPDQDLRQLSFNMGGDKITCKAKKKRVPLDGQKYPGLNFIPH